MGVTLQEENGPSSLVLDAGRRRCGVSRRTSLRPQVDSVGSCCTCCCPASLLLPCYLLLCRLCAVSAVPYGRAARQQQKQSTRTYRGSGGRCRACCCVPKASPPLFSVIIFNVQHSVLLMKVGIQYSSNCVTFSCCAAACSLVKHSSRILSTSAGKLQVPLGVQKIINLVKMKSFRTIDIK